MITLLFADFDSLTEKYKIDSPSAMAYFKPSILKLGILMILSEVSFKQKH